MSCGAWLFHINWLGRANLKLQFEVYCISRREDREGKGSSSDDPNITCVTGILLSIGDTLPMMSS
jgi:hypothetical protein